MRTKTRREVYLNYTGQEPVLDIQNEDRLIATCAANSAQTFFRYLLLLKRKYPHLEIQLQTELWDAAEATGFDHYLR